MSLQSDIFDIRDTLKDKSGHIKGRFQNTMIYLK